MYENVATQGTKLTETKTMPESNYTIIQGTLTLDEFGKLIAALLSSIVYKFCSIVPCFFMACIA